MLHLTKFNRFLEFREMIARYSLQLYRLHKGSFLTMTWYAYYRFYWITVLLFQNHQKCSFAPFWKILKYFFSLILCRHSLTMPFGPIQYATQSSFSKNCGPMILSDEKPHQTVSKVCVIVAEELVFDSPQSISYSFAWLWNYLIETGFIAFCC